MSHRLFERGVKEVARVATFQFSDCGDWPLIGTPTLPVFWQDLSFPVPILVDRIASRVFLHVCQVSRRIVPAENVFFEKYLGQ
jgi:hypothetical protein